jgi:hypothetical protein
VTVSIYLSARREDREGEQVTNIVGTVAVCTKFVGMSWMS